VLTHGVPGRRVWCRAVDFVKRGIGGHHAAGGWRCQRGFAGHSSAIGPTGADGHVSGAYCRIKSRLLGRIWGEVYWVLARIGPGRVFVSCWRWQGWLMAMGPVTGTDRVGDRTQLPGIGGHAGWRFGRGLGERGHSRSRPVYGQISRRWRVRIHRCFDCSATKRGGHVGQRRSRAGFF